MSSERFEHLLSLVGPLIRKEDTQFRKSISPEERLAVTLRFLASGDAQQSLSFSFRIGKSTLSKVISETCEMIHECLKGTFLRPPETEEEWDKIAQSFEELWNMPNVIGSIDGKHIRIQCPKLSGTQFYNYKGFFSVVLLAVCDANYCFTLFDLGQYGSNNDSGILSNSVMGDLLENGKLKIPKGKVISENVGVLPYYLLGDEIFPLKTWLMRPYPGSQSEETQKVYNYRHSRARRVIENAFGILSARWRIFHKPIRASIDNVEKYTLACLSLHNYLRQTDNAAYTPQGFIDSESNDGTIKAGEWRSIQANDQGCFANPNAVRGSRYTKDALAMRDALKNYVNSEEGSLPWQLDHVRRTSHYSFSFQKS